MTKRGHAFVVGRHELRDLLQAEALRARSLLPIEQQPI